MIHEKRFEVRYSELSGRFGQDGSFAKRCADLPAIITYWQDTSMAQTAMLERDAHTRSASAAYVWFLLSWRAEVYRYPAYGETVVSRTWATGFEGVYGYRDFVLLSESGERLAAASTVWAGLDAVTGRLKRCTQEIMDTYGTCADRAFDTETPWKMQLGGKRSRIAEISTRKSDIDSNVHVNNVNYIRMALDAYSGEHDIRKLAVNYKKAAVFGDVICIEKDENGAFILCDTDGDVFAAVQFD